MKCRYNCCKFNGEVEKSKAVKEGSAYYHEECLKEKNLKKEIEEYYINNMPPTVMQILRKAIKQLINEKGFDAEFVLFTCRWIVRNRKPIKSPFGIIYYCTNDKVYGEWNRKKVTKNYNKIKNMEVSDKKVVFNYKPQKRITDLI